MTAVVVQRLLDAGATMVGKTVTDELAYSLSGENVHYGTPVNPRDPSRVAGGSSSGSVAAVAGGLVDFALGTDCAGSVRIPASYCGVLGLRPTHGRVSVEGAIPFGPSFDAVGWFAREPDAFEAVAGVLLGSDRDDLRPTRLLYATDAFQLVDAPVRAALATAVELVASEIGTPKDVQVSQAGLGRWFDTFRVLQAAEIWHNLGGWVSSTRPRLGPGIKERFEWASGVSEQQVWQAEQERRAVVTRLESLLEVGSVLCLPTSPRVAPIKNTGTDKMEVEYRHQAMCLLCIAGLGGLPQLTLPLANLDGLPLGLSLVGCRGSDMALVELGTRVMRAASGLREGMNR